METVRACGVALADNSPVMYPGAAAARTALCRKPRECALQKIGRAGNQLKWPQPIDSKT